MKPVDAHAAAVALGRLGGARKTPAQQAAARENGKKGGRPRKSIVGPHDGVTEWADCGRCGAVLDPTNEQCPRPWDGGCWYCGAPASQVGLKL